MRFLVFTVFLLLTACGKFQIAGAPTEMKNSFDDSEPSQARTKLNQFYGVYETLEQNGKPVEKSAQIFGQSFTCETLAQIGNANIKRIDRSDVSAGIKKLTVVEESFDPETKNLISSDQIWLSPGVITTPSGIKACTEFSVPIFADRGEWAKDENGLGYSFDGYVLSKAIDGKFSRILLKEHLTLKPLGNGRAELSITYKSDTGEFSGRWLLQSR